MTDLSVNSYCVNCDEKGHTVWDRNCPTFIDRCKSLNAANKDSNYLLFVTRDANTWETIDSDRRPPGVGEDDWTPVQRRGTSGRGGGQHHQRAPFVPLPVDRGRPRSNNEGPAANTNRTSLGSTTHYRQLTFEETNQRRHSRSTSRNGQPSQPAAASSSAPPAAPNSSQDRDIYRSWFDDMPLPPPILIGLNVSPPPHHVLNANKPGRRLKPTSDLPTQLQCQQRRSTNYAQLTKSK
jgi:hypothetical protein